MRFVHTKFAAVVRGVSAAALSLTLVAGCDIDQTEEGSLPEVEVRGGNMPEYEVETPEVEVHEERRQIEVPDVDIETETREVTTPDIDVEMPE